ncbi:hypothetical protein A3D07_03795 [Candidatus Curtissbacteria bacterium RIFCSPHIGHO2_02_FULL_42_15]|uniref:Uncharacterized protein n=1 Tax=Candidatus Curtissbacteria bacterium RIFCSPHIGHO2_02_FULL_42_15 TaxID=1797716 RepID=A0A1F5GCY8_9BACT|nr:MAG: hypothetical protein A3D07_03795 [Candidatus Curtissbacteria bacterium RIFCSPHIGHO2_02_FULL_42_15]
MDWNVFLRELHVLGTALGVGGSTFAEIFAIKFAKDKKIDIFEHEILKVCITVIRIGLIILTFSGLGLLVLWRMKLLGSDVFYSGRFLAKMTILLILIFIALLMNFRFVNLKLGSAISTASWYAAMILGIWRGLHASYFAIMLGFGVFVVLVYFLLEYARKTYLKSK